MSVPELMEHPDRHDLAQRALAAQVGERKADAAKAELARQGRGLRT